MSLLEDYTRIKNFQEGAKINAAQDVMYGNRDYDYALAGLAKSLILDSRGHGSDAGKLPSHPTFSDQSLFHGAKKNGHIYTGGQWTEDSFTPSADMINRGATNGLAEYMSKVEPGVKLVTPPPFQTTKKAK